jgi:hypothetical protein
MAMRMSRVLLAAVMCVAVAGMSLADTPTVKSKLEALKTHPGLAKALVGQTITKANSDKDMLRVHVGYATPVNGKLVCLIVARWGDLDNKIAKGGKDVYSKWDGSCAVTGGSVELAGKLAFDDRSGKDPKAGSGIDKITTVSGSEISWEAAVVGATDGLVFKVTFDSASSSATVKAGNFTIPVQPIPAPAPLAAKKIAKPG